jgi:tRNA threonylcarbamoyladenosine biosynthesis protein TsaE
MTKEYRWVLHGEEETRRFAERFAAHLQPGDFLALEGALGAGKTTFTQGLARGLGIKKVVNSPTFTLIKEYMGRLPLYHMDVYRVEDDVFSLGLDEYFFGEGVCVVEWASLIEPYLPEERLTVTLARGEGESRICLFEPRGERYVEKCERFDYDARTGD